MSSRLLVLDNSVLQRVRSGPVVAEAVAAMIRDGWIVCASDVSILEAGFSARFAEGHREIRNRLTFQFRRLKLTEDCGHAALELQTALFERGMGRSVGIVDLLLAGTAVAYDATVLHYDSDFERLAELDDRLRQQWVVPRGSVD